MLLGHIEDTLVCGTLGPESPNIAYGPHISGEPKRHGAYAWKKRRNVLAIRNPMSIPSAGPTSLSVDSSSHEPWSKPL